MRGARESGPAQADPALGTGSGADAAGADLENARRTIQYDTGVSSRPNAVTPIIPENTATPIACRISAPEPLEKTSGTTPAVNAIDVIRIGRTRRRHASMIASHVLAPAASRVRANSTIRIAFLHASPTRTMKPICVKMLLSPFVSHTPAIADKRHIGTIRITTSGNARLS